jgi:hypothetical protein
VSAEPPSESDVPSMLSTSAEPVSALPGWSPVTADPAEEWVLAGGTVAWVRADQLGEIDEVLVRLGELRRRRDQLADERVAELAEARVRGAREGAAAAAAVLAELASYRSELADAAAHAAIEIAVGIVGQAVATDDGALQAFARHALGDLGALEATAVEVAPEMVAPISALLSPLSVVGHADLTATDARVLLPSGKREFRLAEALQHLHEAIRASIEDPDG